MEGDEEEEDLGEGVVPVYVRDMVNNAQKKVKVCAVCWGGSPFRLRMWWKLYSHSFPGLLTLMKCSGLSNSRLLC